MNPRNVLPPANTGGWVASRRTARNSSRIKAGDFSPGAVSTPDNTSTAAAPRNGHSPWFGLITGRSAKFVAACPAVNRLSRIARCPEGARPLKRATACL